MLSGSVYTYMLCSITAVLVLAGYALSYLVITVYTQLASSTPGTSPPWSVTSMLSVYSTYYYLLEDTALMLMDVRYTIDRYDPYCSRHVM